MRSLIITIIVTSVTGNLCNWAKPHNSNAYPKWPYCNRWPGKGEQMYKYMDESIPPADQQAYVCNNGVLRHDSPGLICANYNLGDEYAGSCNDQTCCAEELCSTYKCTAGALRNNAASISCTFPCNDETCCVPVEGYPKHDAQGVIFVDKDPRLYTFGGVATIIRALDESDITHYRVYWGFAKSIRKVPSCGLGNPVSWTQIKWRDPTKLFKQFKKTGCDITFHIPMGTVPNERCPISLDRKERSVAHTDKCNPHYLLVVSVNKNGERNVLIDQAQQVGPKYAIVDYEGSHGLPCLEAGITMGHDLMGPEDVLLGSWNGVSSPKECQRLCQEHNVDGVAIPCRQYTWSLDNGGKSSSSCWIETQALQKQHYTVRFVAPAYCPTRDNTRPTGIEQPRCNRWIRRQNSAPFTNRNIFKAKGMHVAQFPNFPDVPLGPYDNAEYCKNMCDLDVLCTGFTFMKRDPTDVYFHRCILLRAGTFEHFSTPYYDTWVCSRENQAPLISGYSLLHHPWGYKTCPGVPQFSILDVVNEECCSFHCESDSECNAFTFLADERLCELYTNCDSPVVVSQVEGCAYESCFKGKGGSSYLKDSPKLEIIDRWPKTGKGESEGFPVIVQTNRGLEGETVYCTAVISFRNIYPKHVEDMILWDSTKTALYSAKVKDRVANITIMEEWQKWKTSPGQHYRVYCGITNALAKGLSSSLTSHKIELEHPTGYVRVGYGYCKTSKCAPIGFVPGNGFTFTECKEQCSKHPSCSAFWWRRSDGWCHVKTTNCNYHSVNSDNNVQCWKPDANAMVVHDIGKGECKRSCPSILGKTDTCITKRKIGVYDTNVYTRALDDMCTAPLTRRGYRLILKGIFKRGKCDRWKSNKKKYEKRFRRIIKRVCGYLMFSIKFFCGSIHYKMSGTVSPETIIPSAEEVTTMINEEITKDAEIRNILGTMSLVEMANSQSSIRCEADNAKEAYLSTLNNCIPTECNDGFELQDGTCESNKNSFSLLALMAITLSGLTGCGMLMVGIIITRSSSDISTAPTTSNKLVVTHSNQLDLGLIQAASIVDETDDA